MHGMQREIFKKIKLDAMEMLSKEICTFIVRTVAWIGPRRQHQQNDFHLRTVWFLKKRNLVPEKSVLAYILIRVYASQAKKCFPLAKSRFILGERRQIKLSLSRRERINSCTYA